MKKVLITGGTRGIGKAAAELFLSLGYEVFVTYVKSEDFAEALRSKGIKAIKADVSVRSDVENLSAETGNIDILVNNAGIAHYGMLCHMTMSQWQKLFDVNVTGAFNCIQVFSPHMVRQKWGRIINLSSVWGVTGGSCEAAYSATKSAVIGLSKALAKELGPSGITVNCVAPGTIETDMNSHLSKEEEDAIKEETPLCRMGKPCEVAKAIVYLAEADFVTGEVLNINGGMHI